MIPVSTLLERTVHINSEGRVSAGIILDDSYIVTTRHGISNHTVITDSYGNVIDGVVVFTDPYSDVAIISADTDMGPLELSDAGIGERVYAVGHPDGRPYIITAGVISSTGMGAPVSVQHDAATFSGSSGGPVFDGNGRLVAMSAAGDGLSFAIPHYIITSVVKSVDEYGSYTPGCIGVMIDHNVVRSVRERVSHVVAAGDVIESVDGREPFNILYDREPGEIVDVVINGEIIPVQLGYMGEWFGIHACKG